MLKQNIGNFDRKASDKNRQIFGSCLVEITPEMSEMTISQLGEYIAKAHKIHSCDIELIGINATITYAGR
jgi:hypothetical protein